MIQSALHRRINLTLAAVVLAIAGFAALLPSAAHAAGTWKAQTSDTSGLDSVTFIDTTHGWAARWGGGILATGDGGAHWTAHDDGPSTSQKGELFFVDATHGWAVNAHIYATTDGGATWVAQTSSDTDEFHAITFVDATHGWAVGSHPGTSNSAFVIAATTDGGATWTTQVSADVTGDVMSDRRGNPGLNSVAFTDAHHGWAVGYGGAILATSDGGATWTAQTSGTNATLKCVTFADSRHGWAVGSGAGGASNNAPVILATSDGGAIWKAQDASSAGSSAVLYSVAFTDADHGWAVGATYESNFTASYGVILATSDGGTTWAAEESGTKDPLNSVSFVDDTHGWAVGDRGTILVYNTAPAPVGAVSSKGAGAWPVEAVIIVLVIIGALVLSLRARRRRAIRVALTADLPASDSRRPAGGAGQLSPASESSEKAVHCTACGAPARATSAFCGSCGAKVVPRNE